MSGKSSNCGCVKVLNLKKRVTTHGYTKNWNIPKEYKSWAEAKRRCLDDSRPAWKDYGGRGISMCEAWQNSFEEFFLHMGNCPKGKSLDRINNEGNYEPGNCRWATRSEQGNNTRRTRWIDFNGKTKTLSGWAEWLGVKIGVISYRLDIVGLSIEDAMSDIVSKHKLKNTP